MGIAARAFFVAGLAPLLALSLAKCDAGTLDLTGKQCPCVDGYVCDPSTNTCVPGGSTVPDRGATGDDGGSSPGDATSSDRAVEPIACDGASCCKNDRDCTNPAQPVCGPGGSCVECLPSADNCPTLHYCTEEYRCAVGCKANVECAGAYADSGDALKLCNTTRHDCVECLGNADCATGMLCSPSGTCVVGCDLEAGAGCPAGKTCCDKLCIDATSDTDYCGSCTTDCISKVKNASDPACSKSACTYATCSSGYDDCNGNRADGCETALGTTTHCASCSDDCDAKVTNATGIGCSGSHSCTYAACASGFDDCDGNRANGCEASLASVTTCGSCGTDCTTQVVHADGVACGGGACTFTSCQLGYGDCNKNAADGCECACGMKGQQCCPGNTCPGARWCLDVTCY